MSRRYVKRAEVWAGDRPIPPNRFGSDHWHMLIHVASVRPVQRTHWTQGPTLLRDAELHGHTDLDVLNDLASAGLIYLFAGERRPSAVGAVVRSDLVAHLSRGGNYSNFEPHAATQLLAS